MTICARGRARLGEAAGELRGLATGEGRVLAVAADLATAAGVEAVIAQTVDTFGGLDILVNNVGVAKGAGIVDTSDAEWQGAFRHEVFPGVLPSRFALPMMWPRGSGAIVLIAFHLV